MSLAGDIRWRPTGGKGGERKTGDSRFEGCRMYQKWINSTVGPWVIQAPDENATPGNGQVLGFGRSMKAATADALGCMSEARRPLRARLSPALFPGRAASVSMRTFCTK